MNKKIFLLPFIVMSSFSVISCSALQFDKYIDLVVMDVSNPTAAQNEWTYEEVTRTKINIFNSAILPDKPNVTSSDYAFLGYGLKDFEKGVSKKSDFYARSGLVRYNDVKDYAVDGVVTLKAAYCAPEDVPTRYLVVGWYARTRTSGLTTDIMDGFQTMLMDYLVECKDKLQYGEVTVEELGFNVTDDDLLDVEVRAYDGDVATIGGNITFDGDVDIFLGAGVNLGSQGGVTYEKRNAYEIAGVADRYLYQLNDRDQVKGVYSWMRTSPVRAYFRGE